MDNKLGPWLSNEIPSEYKKKHPAEWLNRILFDIPVRTPKYSPEKLQEMGYSGVYFNPNVKRLQPL